MLPILAGVVAVGGVITAVAIANNDSTYVPPAPPVTVAPDSPADEPADDEPSVDDLAVDLDALAEGCAAGNLSDCDSLYWESEAGSDYESFAASCGDRGVDLRGSCEAELPFPYIYGDDATLDSLSDACDGGDMVACDDLYFNSESGSAYETWGATCGGRLDPVNGVCEDAL